MFLFLVLFAGVCWLVFYRFDRKIVSLSRKLPGDIPSWPIVGHAYLLRGNDEDQMKVFQRTGMISVNRGGLASYWIANRLYVVVTDPVAAEIILKSNLEKDYVMKFMRYLTGNGSIYAKVPIWRPRRKHLAPTFNIKNLNRFVEVFARQSSVMVKQLRAVADAGTFSVWKFLTTYTFDAVCETSLGVEMNAQRKENHVFLEALDEITQLIGTRMVQPWLYADWVYRCLPQSKRADKCRKYMYDFIDEVVRSKRKELEFNRAQSQDKQVTSEPMQSGSFLDMLLESSKASGGFTDLELREETLVMTVAGTDTSAVGASFAFVMLSRHPEVQQKVYEELQEVLGGSCRSVAAEDLPRLKYLEAVIKETLRLYPPVPVIVRSIDNDVQLPSGITLLKGVGILINIWAIHRNPLYWGSDIEDFRPERFLNTSLKHPAQFMPFSHGLRNCIGYQYAIMSMKTVIATVLHRYRILPPDDADQKKLKEPLRVKFDIMMKDVDKFQIRLETRR